MTNDAEARTAMRRAKIVEIICSLYTEIVYQGKSPQTQADEQTCLFGAQARLDSLGLVNLLLDVEQQVNDRFHVLISLMNEQAMSQRTSPFRTVETLTSYIDALLDAEH